MRLSAAPRWCGGHHPVCDAESGPIRLSFNPQLRVEFRGATVTSEAGLLLPRELDEQLGLSGLIERHLADPRTGHNRQFPLPDLFRQSIYSRLAGYEDTNDAERLAEDPAFRMMASRERRETSIALTSTLHWFETDVLAQERNYQGLAHLNTELIQRAATRSPTRRVILDIDSSESPVHGGQEQSAYNGHFESVCYHPLFVFNPDAVARSEEHTSKLQSQSNLVCRLLLEKKKTHQHSPGHAVFVAMQQLSTGLLAALARIDTSTCAALLRSHLMDQCAKPRLLQNIVLSVA